MTEAAETTISTPAETATSDTSASEVSTTETTSQTEPESNVETAENGTEAQQTTETAEPTEKQEPEKLYANKYKSIEELEKGYAEAQKTLTQNAQFKQKYEELLKQQEAKQAIELEKVKQQGFNSIEEQQIARNADIAELNAYWNNVNYVGVDNAAEVQNLLQSYNQTGNKAYLEEAKRYFPSDFIETIAINKADYINQSKSQLAKQQETKANQQRQEQEKQLAETIKTDYADFLSDLNTNTGKSMFLEAACNLEFIRDKADMDKFVEMYSEMAKYEREQAIKEYEAQKVIDETKNKASIGTDGVNNNTTEPIPTAEMVSRNYQKYIDDYMSKGLSFAEAMKKADEIIMKG